MKLKKINLFALISLFFVVSFLGMIFFGEKSFAVTCPTDMEEVTGVCIPSETNLPDAGGSDDPVITVVTTFMLWILSLVGILGVIAFAISGIQYLISAGNENMIETAKRNMTWSVVGVVVALMGLIILTTVNTLLSEDNSTDSLSQGGLDYLPNNF